MEHRSKIANKIKAVKHANCVDYYFTKFQVMVSQFINLIII